MNSHAGPVDLVIKPVGAFSWESSMDMLRNWKPVAGAWQGGRLLMAFCSDHDFEPVAVELRPVKGGVAVRTSAGADPAATAAQVGRFLSLDVDATGYDEIAAREPAVGRLMAELPGLRPVLFPSPWHAAVWAVISQRISMAQAARIQDRLAREHGTRLEVGGAEVYCVPSPAQALEIAAFAGLAEVKLERLHGLAAAALKGELDPCVLSTLAPNEAVRRLKRLPGIGDFWASGIHVRGCRVLDVFPEEPKALQALAAVRGLEEVPAGDRLRRVTEVYSPFRMWVCVLLRVARNRGLVPTMGPEHAPGRGPGRAAAHSGR